ncbi:hypothetical protein AB1Y20_000523 [Prymnesium parvum]|uniref:Fe2OG dioxygenase domain-containing protein n=1 Tax=Prymnesium parvum TaxID=97485 RepID=A0AB34K634_PRYPA
MEMGSALCPYWSSLLRELAEAQCALQAPRSTALVWRPAGRRPREPRISRCSSMLPALAWAAPLVSALTVGTLPRSSPTPVAQSPPLAPFEAAVQLCELRSRGVHESLSPSVPRLLRQVFDEDFRRVLRTSGDRAKTVHNLTCFQPEEGVDGSLLFDEALTALPLREGRVCLGGECCSACSRVTFPQLATHRECVDFRRQLDSVMAPASEHPHHNLYLASCAAAGDVRTTLTFIRLVERMRRVVAHEYGLQLANIAPRSTFISRITGDAVDESRRSLHVDESSYSSFHYSCVLYLSSQGEDFEGGGFSFSDPPESEGGSRVLRSLLPRAGLAIAFSSGWENAHFVEPVLAGSRFAMPTFFSTRPSSAGEDDNYVFDDEVIADSLWRMALMPETENDCRQLLQQWHQLFTEST